MFCTNWTTHDTTEDLEVLLHECITESQEDNLFLQVPPNYFYD